MSLNKISLKITTLSNLFIGGSPKTFEIGGVDLFTVTNYEGHPYIPASSFKGSLRSIVRDRVSDPQAERIKECYINYLNALYQENIERLKQIEIGDERMERMNQRFTNEIKCASAECLFGIAGFNDTPKLIFNDLVLANAGKIEPFSIDSKNNIEQSSSNKDASVAANPRTYKTVRPGVEFRGEILLYRMEQLQIEQEVIIGFVERAIQEFNTGIYRLGNSGSRGYGKVHIEIMRERD
jgi:CRISPR-associated protein Csm3